MEVDAPTTQETSDTHHHHHSTYHQQLHQISPSDYHSEASMNFDHLQDLRADAMASSSPSGSGGGGNGGNSSYGLVDDSRALDRLLFHHN